MHFKMSGLVHFCAIPGVWLDLEWKFSSVLNYILFVFPAHKRIVRDYENVFVHPVVMKLAIRKPQSIQMAVVL